MTINTLLLIAAAAGKGPLVTLSGETIIDGSTIRATTAGIRVGSNGIIEKLVNVTLTQIDSATDWIIPNNAASIDYDVRITNVVFTTGTVFSAAAAVEDTWIDLGTDRSWNVADTDSSTPAGDTFITFDLQIRDPSGVTVASTEYILKALYTP